MLLWFAILLLTDAGLALWHEDRLTHLLPRWNVKVVALAEAGLAFCLIAWHFFR